MGCHRFGPTLRKPSTKKKHCGMWIKSLREKKRTEQFFRGGQDVLTPLSKLSSSRLQSGLASSFKLKKGTISPQKNIEKSRSSNSRLHSGMVHGESTVEHSRSSSSRQDNAKALPLKKTVKNAPVSLHKNRPSSFSMDNIGRDPVPRKTKVHRPSLARPHNDRVSRPKVDEKSRLSRLRDDESSSCKFEIMLSSRGSKDDSNFTYQIPKKAHPFSVVRNSSNAKQMPIGHVQKEDQVIENHHRNPGDNYCPKVTHGLQFNDDKSNGKRTKSLLEEKLGTSMKRTKPHDDSDSKEVHNNCKLVKRGKYIYEDNDDGDQNILGAEVATDSLTTSTVVMKDRCTEVSNPLVLESSKVQEHSDLPIDEPIWSGDFKLGSKGYGSLAAHLFAKHCEKVWKISKLLRPVVEVTKLPRLEAWPKSFEASRPIDESIALYFLPHEMRHNVGLDQLVKEVTENDMVLRAVVEEAEMLIFPSILLPERHQTFKGKSYPWAVFKRRENKVVTPTLDEEGHVIDCCARVEEKHASPRKDHRVTGLNMGVEPEEVERQVTKQEQTSSFARPKESRPSEGTACPTQTPTIRAIMHANHGDPLMVWCFSRCFNGTIFWFYRWTDATTRETHQRDAKRRCCGICNARGDDRFRSWPGKYKSIVRSSTAELIPTRRHGLVPEVAAYHQPCT